MTMRQITTVIVDDEKPACERLERLLKFIPEVQVVESFTNSVKASDFIKKNRPGLVFLDVEMDNNVSAFDVIKELHENGCHPFFILVTAHEQYSIKAIKNEVFDYLLKPVDIDELKLTIGRLVNHISSGTETIPDTLSMLSKREKEILRHVLAGESSIEIAETLFLSINTINTHRRNILEKTGCKSVLEIIRISHS
jgi:two-component system LytT family response regulator